MQQEVWHNNKNICLIKLCLQNLAQHDSMRQDQRNTAQQDRRRLQRHLQIYT